MPSNVPTFAALFSDDFSLSKLGEDAMPKDLQGFTRETYETIDRVVGDPFGKSSQRWVYRKGNLTVGISLDYPYDGVKDLCECYSLVGWDISEQQLLDEKTLAESLRISDSGGPVARAELFRDLFGQGHLLFSSFDLAGNCRAVIKEIARGNVDQRAENRLLTFGNQQDNSQDVQPPALPYIQVHLLARSFDKITPEVQSELLSLFIEARRILTPTVLKANTSPLSENQTKESN